MAGIAKQAVVVSMSRFANYGLLLISPIVLVRLLTVGEFGRYREFLVYSSVLASIAAFGIPNSLLYFVPADPARFLAVRPTGSATHCNHEFCRHSLRRLADLATGGTVIGNSSARGDIRAGVHEHRFLGIPMAGDQRRSRCSAIPAAGSSRACWWSSRWPIFSPGQDRSLGLDRIGECQAAGFGCGLEASRPQSRDACAESGDWRRMLHFCLPIGGSNLLSMSNRYAASIFVAKAMGPVRSPITRSVRTSNPSSSR